MKGGIATAASVTVERARIYGSPTRVYLQPDGKLTLANHGQHSKKIMYSQLVGLYDSTCPLEWIREDIEAALKENETICPCCGSPLPR